MTHPLDDLTDEQRAHAPLYAESVLVESSSNTHLLDAERTASTFAKALLTALEDVDYLSAKRNDDVARLTTERDEAREHFAAAADETVRLTAERDALIVRRDELIVAIRRLHSDLPYPEEANQVPTLIAKVGTLKSALREATTAALEWLNYAERDGSSHWTDDRARLDALAKEAE